MAFSLNVFVMFDFIGQNNSDELCDTGKNQISMQRPLILCLSSCETEMIFDVVDISFDNSSYFRGATPFFGSADCSGISTQILFRTDINHTIASGSGSFATALFMRFFGGWIVSPYHFGTDKLEPGNTSS